MTKRILILLWVVVAPFYLFSQSTSGSIVDEMRLKLNEDGSHYLK